MASTVSNGNDRLRKGNTRWRRSQNGELFQQYRLVVGMHSAYFVAKDFRGYFKGKFWFSVLLLFYLEAIYLPVLKSLVHIYEMSQINPLWLNIVNIIKM